jgi:hypothetical protein
MYRELFRTEWSATSPSQQVTEFAIKRNVQRFMADEMYRISLINGAQVTIGPTGYSGYIRLMAIKRDFQRCFPDKRLLEICHLHLLNSLCKVTIQKILRDDIDSCLEYVMLENGWTDIHDRTIFPKLRGCERTWAAALAAFIANIPNYTISVMGTKQTVMQLCAFVAGHLQDIVGNDPCRFAKFRMVCTGKHIGLMHREDDERWMSYQIVRDTRNAGRGIHPLQFEERDERYNSIPPEERAEIIAILERCTKALMDSITE